MYGCSGVWKMFSMKRFVFIVILLSVFVSLPTATQCDTSYYEKYYSARRYMPVKKPLFLPYDFTVTLKNEKLADFEQIALIGNQKPLGKWKPNKAILLNRTAEHNVWSGTVLLSPNTTISYRYFVAVVTDEHDTQLSSLQIRRWESNINARTFNVTNLPGNRSDIFGWISKHKKEVQRGWLNSGLILQFRLFRNPFEFIEPLASGDKLRVKFEAIEPHMLTPILPSARAYTEYVRMSYGNSFLHEQPKFGVPYDSNDTIIFQTTLNDLNQVAFLLKLYVTRSNSNLVRFVGYQFIYPSSFTTTEGNFAVNLVSPVWFNSIGTLNLQYLLITPMPNSTIDFHTTFIDYWRTNWTELEVGHRGLGKSLSLASNIPPIIENTVASMKAAGALGVDLVEFDVHLTSDLIPIIYHDYVIYVCMDPKTPTNKDDLTPVLIKDVTYEQLKNLKTYQVVGNKIIEYPAHNNVENEDQRLFPLFEDFLTKINKTVGFDIEIKWPQKLNSGAYESEQTIDKNIYIDRILDVMLRHGCGRLSFFTSFDADICVLLRLKQNMYPVMFLSSKAPDFADPRTDTITDTINTAQAFDLAGIVPHSAHIKNDTKWIEMALKQNKKIFIWGADLKDTDSIKWYKDQGPTGVIYDRVDLWLPFNKHSAFEMENDLPEFFELQCRTQDFNIGINKTVESILSNINML